MLDSTATATNEGSPAPSPIHIELKAGEELSDQQLRVLAAALAHQVPPPSYSGHPSNLYGAVRDHSKNLYDFFKGSEQ